MSDSELKEEIAAAEAYEGLHVPALMGAWAPRVLDAARVAAGDRVLDVACGTGIVAREALGRVGADGHVAGVDLGAGMLAVAERIAPEITWRQGPADALPFDDASFDVVTCQFGLMFFPDREAALAEMQRVLAPGGRLSVAVWDRLENSEPYASEVAILERMAGSAAADALRAPFVLGDREALVDLFRRAGVARVEITTQRTTARFPSVRTLVEADLRGWLPIMGVALDEARIEEILAACERELAAFVAEDGCAVFQAPGHVVTGRFG